MEQSILFAAFDAELLFFHFLVCFQRKQPVIIPKLYTRLHNVRALRAEPGEYGPYGALSGFFKHLYYDQQRSSAPFFRSLLSNFPLSFVSSTIKFNVIPELFYRVVNNEVLASSGLTRLLTLLGGIKYLFQRLFRISVIHNY